MGILQLLLCKFPVLLQKWQLLLRKFSFLLHKWQNLICKLPFLWVFCRARPYRPYMYGKAVHLAFYRPYMYGPYMYGILPDICRTFAAQKPLIKMAVFLFQFFFFDSIMGIVYGKCTARTCTVFCRTGRTWPYTKMAVHFALYYEVRYASISSSIRTASSLWGFLTTLRSLKLIKLESSTPE